MVRYAPPGQIRRPNSRRWTGRRSATRSSTDRVGPRHVLHARGRSSRGAPGAWVTPGFMQGLGIRPAIGLDSTPRRSHRKSSVRAHQPSALAQPLYGRPADRRSAVQRVCQRSPRRGRGVHDRRRAAGRFWHLNPYTDVLVPLRAATYPYLVRLHEGVTPGDAAARMTALIRAGATNVAPDWRVEIVPAHEQYVATIPSGPSRDLGSGDSRAAHGVGQRRRPSADSRRTAAQGDRGTHGARRGRRRHCPAAAPRRRRAGNRRDGDRDRRRGAADMVSRR